MAKLTHHDRAKNALERAQLDVANFVDVTGLPLDHDLGNEIARCFGELYDLIDAVVRNGTRPEAAYEKDVIVFPISGRDMRDWPTSDRNRGVRNFLLRDRPILLSMPTRIFPRRQLRSAITSTEFLDALRESVSE